MRAINTSPERLISYGYKKHVDGRYEQTIARVKNELKKEGFGVLSEIDIKDKLKDKIGADFRNYIILGACNPELAYQALQQELDIGLLLPCNVVVYEDETGCTISVARPDRLSQYAQNDQLEPIAKQADEKLRRVLDRLC
jgi:uncharacterized protein (DUF302 family)